MIRLSRFVGVLALLAFAIPALAQGSPIGTWATVDDESGETKSHVRIYESGGKLVGDIVTLLPAGRRCVDCAGKFNNSTMRGERILWGFTRDGDTWTGGRILDPKTGKEYKAKMKVQRDGTLYLRGYIGIPTLGRTQNWIRVR